MPDEEKPEYQSPFDALFDALRKKYAESDAITVFQENLRFLKEISWLADISSAMNPFMSLQQSYDAVGRFIQEHSSIVEGFDIPRLINPSDVTDIITSLQASLPDPLDDDEVGMLATGLCEFCVVLRDIAVECASMRRALQMQQCLLANTLCGQSRQFSELHEVLTRTMSSSAMKALIQYIENKGKTE